MDAVWAQVEQLRPESLKISRDNEYLCPCGGVKVFDLLPVCTSCGRTDSEYITDEPEWRGGIDDDGEVSDPSRVGAPTDDRFSEAWSMGTIMNVRPNASYALKKLARIDFHTSMNYKDRSLFHNYQDLERAGKHVLNLPVHVVKDSEHMYRKFGEERLTRGAVRMGIKANCLLHACKKNGVARSIQEIADAFGIPAKDISRTTELFRNVVVSKDENSAVCVTLPSNVIVRMFNEFNTIPDEERRRLKMKAIRICEKIQESPELMGKTPKTIAAVVLFVVLENIPGVTKYNVCEKCGVSVPTLNKIEPVIKSMINV